MSNKFIENIKLIFIWLAIVISLVFFMFPIYWIIQMSLKNAPAIGNIPPNFIFSPTLENFITIFTRRPFSLYLTNSLIISLGVTIISVVIGAMAGYSLSRHRTKFTKRFINSVLLFRAIPAVTIAIPIYILLQRAGLLGNRSGIILAHLSFILPMSIWILKTFFDNIPKELEEQARVDGASTVRVFTSIILPLARPGLISAGLLSMIFSWNEFLFSLVLSDTASRPLSVAVAAFAGSQTIEWGQMAAAATTTILPMIIFAFTMQRYLVKGLVSGTAIKG